MLPFDSYIVSKTNGHCKDKWPSTKSQSAFRISKILQRGLQTPDESRLQYEVFPWCDLSPCGIWVSVSERVDGISVVWDCWVRLMLQYIAEV